MQEIPIIHIKNNKISDINTFNEVQLLLNRLQSSIVYIFDEDGINKNQMNVSIYQKFSSIINVWVDAGPRNVDDIVDEVFSGANRIIIRKDLWEEDDLKNAIDVTENELMVLYSSQEIQKGIPTDILFHDAQGIVIYFIQNCPLLDFKIEGFLKQIAQSKPTYILNANMKTKKYWSSFMIEGMLVPIEKLEV